MKFTVSEGSRSADKRAAGDSETMSRRTEMADNKANFPGKSAQHDKVQGFGDMVNAAAV